MKHRRQPLRCFTVARAHLGGYSVCWRLNTSNSTRHRRWYSLSRSRSCCVDCTHIHHYENTCNESKHNTDAREKHGSGLAIGGEFAASLDGSLSPATLHITVNGSEWCDARAVALVQCGANAPDRRIDIVLLCWLPVVATMAFELVMSFAYACPAAASIFPPSHQPLSAPVWVTLCHVPCGVHCQDGNRRPNYDGGLLPPVFIGPGEPYDKHFGHNLQAFYGGSRGAGMKAGAKPSTLREWWHKPGAQAVSVRGTCVTSN